MKRCLLKNLTEGMVTAEDVFVNGTQLLIPRNVVLTKNIILLLMKHGITSVQVQEEKVEKKVEQESSYLDKIRSSKEFIQFKQDYEQTALDFSNFMNDLVEKNINFESDLFFLKTFQLIQNASSSTSILDFLISMRDYDDSTYCHSMNVAMLCGLLADWLHLSPNEKQIAIICGLFHDIGKLQIPVDIIQKPAALTNEEFEIIKNHTLYGFRILSRPYLEKQLDPHVKYAALMHHEKCDGTGYPLGKSFSQIDFYAKIVAVCDVYDAMTSTRVYRKALCPFTVIEHFENEGLQKYDPEILLPFLDHVVNTYINHTVKLSNGQIGNIIFINKINLAKPTVKCEDSFIDLSRNQDIHIEQIL